MVIHGTCFFGGLSDKWDWQEYPCITAATSKIALVNLDGENGNIIDKSGKIITSGTVEDLVDQYNYPKLLDFIHFRRSHEEPIDPVYAQWHKRFPELLDEKNGMLD